MHNCPGGVTTGAIEVCDEDFTMSGLLSDGPTLCAQPNIIRALGDHLLAIFVQQVHYLTTTDHNGQRWAVLTNDEWCDRCVLTTKQFRRVLARLVDLGVVVRQQNGSYDRTAWTRVDYSRLDLLVNVAEASRNQPDATSPGGLNQSSPKGHVRSRPKRPDVPLFQQGGTREEQGAATASPSPRTIATDIANAYWEHVKAETGKSPQGIRHQALVGVITPFIHAGWSVLEVKHALATMRERCRPITRQVLEEHLEGRAARAQRRRQMSRKEATLDRIAAITAPANRPELPS